MPSVAGKQETAKNLVEMPEGFQNLQVQLEKKIRNLEKKKNRLDDYQKRRNSGETLNEQQEEALAQMSVTVSALEMTKEFLQMVADQGKIAKKVEKRHRIEREKQELDVLKRLLAVQSMLDELGSEETKELFSSGHPIAGTTLSRQQLGTLDDLYQAITPRRELQQSGDKAPSWDSRLQQSAENCTALLEGRERQMTQGATYRQAADLIAKLTALPYFSSACAPARPTPQPVEANNAADEELGDDNNVDVADAAATFEPVATEPPASHAPEAKEAAQRREPPATPTCAVVADAPLQPPPPQQQQQPMPAPPQQQQEQMTTLNDIRQQCSGQFDFVLDSELDTPAQTPQVQTPQVQTPQAQKPQAQKPQPQKPQPQKPQLQKQQGEAQLTVWNSSAPTDWANATEADSDLGKPWDLPQGEWNSTPTAAAAPSAAGGGGQSDLAPAGGGGGSGDVFSSATQSDYLKSGDALDEEGGFSFTRGGRGGGGVRGRAAGVGVAAGVGNAGGMGGVSGGVSGSVGVSGFRGGRGVGQRSRPARGTGSEMRGGGGGPYRGGGGRGRDEGFGGRGRDEGFGGRGRDEGFGGRGRDEGFGGRGRDEGFGGRGGRGGQERGGSSSYSRPRGGGGNYRNNAYQQQQQQ